MLCVQEIQKAACTLCELFWFYGNIACKTVMPIHFFEMEIETILIMGIMLITLMVLQKRFHNMYLYLE